MESLATVLRALAAHAGMQEHRIGTAARRAQELLLLQLPREARPVRPRAPAGPGQRGRHALVRRGALQGLEHGPRRVGAARGSLSHLEHHRAPVGAQVLEVLRNHAMPDAADSLSEWAAGYVQYYCKPL